MAEGVIVKTVTNTMVFDGSTTDPSQKAVREAMIAFMAATARAQAEATKAAKKAVSPMRSSSPRRTIGAGSLRTPTRSSTSCAQCWIKIRVSVPLP
jgi:putative DNA-invertase from lambdoid prophage Rac